MQRTKITLTVVLFCFFTVPVSAQSWEALNQQAVEYYHLGDYKQAILYAERALEQCEKEYGKKHEIYSVSLNNLAASYQAMGQYEKALPLLLVALENTEKSLGKDHSEYGIRLDNLAGVYRHMGQYEKALPLYLEALENAEKSLGKDHSEYGIHLNNLAGLYRDMGQYEKALPLLLVALENTEKSFGKDHSEYGIRLNNLAALYKAMGQYEKALPLTLEALENAEKTLGKGHSDYSTYLNALALLYMEMGQYEKALPLALEALEDTEKTLGKDHPHYGTYMNNLAGVYENMGQYEKALPLFLEALENIEKTLGKDHPHYGRQLNNLAGVYENMGQYEKALPLALEALENTEKTLGKDHPHYGRQLNNLAGVYENMGQYKKALPLALEALENTEKTLGKDHPHYGRQLNNLAGVYENMGQYKKALPLALEALENAENTLGKGHSDYSTCLNTLAGIYRKTGQYEKALPLYLEALENTEKTLGKDHPNYGLRLNNLAGVYENLGQYEKALPLFLEALENTKKSLGKDHSEYGIRLNNLAKIYENIGQYEKVFPLYSEAKANLYKQLEQVFSFVSEIEKENFSKEKTGFFFERYKSFYSYYNHNKPDLSEEFYNDELVQKGIILQSNLALQHAIQNSGDESLIKNFEELQTIKRTIAKQSDLPLAKQTSDIDSLQNISETLEREITRQASGINDFPGFFNTKLSWRDVRDHLRPGEAAIEFSSFDYYHKGWTDSTLYCALVLRKQDTIPQLIYLFEEKELSGFLAKNEHGSDKVFINQLYNSRGTRVLASPVVDPTTEDLYSLIWQPIDSLLQGISKVYYAPSGLLHTISFAALKTDSTHYLSDDYQLTSLSSTRQLVEGKDIDQSQVKSPVLYGGIDYNADTTAWQQMSTAYNFDTTAYYTASRSYLPTDPTRGNTTWPYLPGTLEEVKAIVPVLTKGNIRPRLFTGVQATEESYKALSGLHSPKILHIATHGFYFPLKEEKPREKFNSLSREEHYNVMENPLRRAGLLLTGANHTWNNEAIPPALEDGILTAWEVSNTWLGNTDLVVLSACETGLGEIKGGEGVFGLQRAFKMAGANYIMMSLWQVPDKETAEFMTSFYADWFSGMEIRDAFLKTQNTMKVKYAPYYWAAFVLVN